MIRLFRTILQIPIRIHYKLNQVLFRAIRLQYSITSMTTKRHPSKWVILKLRLKNRLKYN